MLGELMICSKNEIINNERTTWKIVKKDKVKKEQLRSEIRFFEFEVLITSKLL
jgi:hypothetical protein